MSEHNDAALGQSRCASCGIAENDDVALKNCTACYLVKYCGIKCQKDHRKQHKRACNKRAAELRDELLFKQPESSYLGDCPICVIPLPLDEKKSGMCYSCSKVICLGCLYANQMRQLEMRVELNCPFCREAWICTEEEQVKRNMKRVEMNDPNAICDEGLRLYTNGDFSTAFEYLTKAADLGNAEAHNKLAHMYEIGEGIEKDTVKETYHLEKAAVAGHTRARVSLGLEEATNGSMERAKKHWIIAANLGDDHAIKVMLKTFKMGLVSKEELDSALRAHQSAVEATKSPQRVAAPEVINGRWEIKNLTSR